MEDHFLMLPHMTTKYIYKICLKTEWEAAIQAQVYHGSTVDRLDRFIHFSTAEQTVETASKHFPAVDGLVLIKINSEYLNDALKWEKARNGALFPHLYGSLDPGLAEWVTDLPLGDAGIHIFPSID